VAAKPASAPSEPSVSLGVFPALVGAPRDVDSNSRDHTPSTISSMAVIRNSGSAILPEEADANCSSTATMRGAERQYRRFQRLTSAIVGHTDNTCSRSEPWIPRCSGEVIFDVVATGSGEPVLIPIDGVKSSKHPVKDLSEDTLVTIRVFRFFEALSNESQDWEHKLRNVNSGSILWLLVHLLPGMHSASGAKYGKWFTVHHLRIYAKHFASGYHMCNDGTCPIAKTFGSSSAITRLVSGKKLPRGYFWYVSPDGDGLGKRLQDVSRETTLIEHGWQHLARDGPFDGDVFLQEWRRGGSPMDETGLQAVFKNIAPVSIAIN